MFETLSLPISPAEAALWLGLVLGLAFGALAQATALCFRAALVGDHRAGAAALWATALAAALLGTQGAVAAGWIDFSGHRFHAPGLPLLAIGLGGVLFGAGMVLARGCAARLTVLAASGNLRAGLALLVLAAVALATMRGVLAPVRAGLAAPVLPLGGALPGPGLAWAAGAALAAAALAWRARPGGWRLAAAAGLGLLVPAGWIGTGWVLADPFDPIPLESLSFTAPLADALFWSGAATGVPARFGTGLVGGTLAGALVAALLRGGFRWQGFESAAPGQTARSAGGAALMGFGGVLAGGCTVGAGLAGVSTLGLSGVLALAAIAAGGLAAQALAGLAAAPGRAARTA